MHAVEQWALAQDCHELGSDTEALNVESQEVHRRLGFETTEQLVYLRKTLQ